MTARAEPPAHPRIAIPAAARARVPLLSLALGFALLEPLSGAEVEAPSPEASLPVLTNLAQVRSLASAEARRGYPVRVRGVITYYEPKWDTLFIQEGTNGSYVFPTDRARPRYKAGDLLEVEGRTFPGALVNGIVEERIAVIGTAPLPPVLPLDYAEFATGRYDSQFIEVEGIVRAMTSEWQRMEFDLATQGGRFVAHLPRLPREALPTRLLHARVRIRGVCGTIVNQKDELVGVRLFVPNLEQISLVKPEVSNPLDLPVIPLSQALDQFPPGALVERVHARGIVTLQWTGGKVFIQDAGRGAELEMARARKLFDPEALTLPDPAPIPLRPGDRVDAVGYPARRHGVGHLEEAEVRVLDHPGPVEPEDVTVREALDGGWVSTLIRTTGRLIEVLTPDLSQGNAHRYLLDRDGIQFEIHLESAGPTGLNLRTESELQVTGVCTLARDDSRPGASLRLLLRGPADIVVLRGPPVWFTREALRILGFAVAVVLAGSAWIALLRRRIAQRTTELSQTNAMLTDEIRQRSHTEISLRESEERFEKAFRSSPAILSLTRLEDERLVDANEAFFRISGLTRAETIGKKLRELALWTDPEQRRQLLERARANRKIDEMEYVFRSKDGTERTVLLSAEVVDIQRTPHVLTVAVDISARKRAEEELQKSLALEKELGELKSNFVSMVSHEFRTPLGIIMSSADILDRYLDRLPAHDRQEYLKAINKSVARMSGLMEEVLLLSKVEAGQMQCMPAPLDLGDFCRRLTDELHSATNRQCPIELQAERLPPVARADEKLLRHIFTNLLSNAVKYSPAGSPVIFRVRAVEANAVFQVEDRGLGIPAADQHRLFKAFYRGQNVGQLAGTGLGLTIVKRCVDLHGGTIEFESREGAGSRFTVILPVFQAPAPPSDPAPMMEHELT